jgi:spermidine synthase
MIRYEQPANEADAVARTVEAVVDQGRTAYQEYLFFRSPLHGMCLCLDGDIQSCASDEALYHEALVHPALLFHDAPARVLVMGGGEGATAREVLRHGEVERLVMVDLDREFIDLCRRHIPEWSSGVWDDPRLELRCEDINAYLEEGDEAFDVVIGDLVDVQDPDAPAAALYSDAFYRRLATRMAPGALLATQAGALVPGAIEQHNRTRRTLAEALGHARTYGLAVPSFYGLWGFILASSDGVAPDAAGCLARLADTCAARGLDLPATGPEALAAAFALPRHIGESLA